MENAMKHAIEDANENAIEPVIEVAIEDVMQDAIEDTVEDAFKLDKPVIKQHIHNTVSFFKRLDHVLISNDWNVFGISHYV